MRTSTEKSANANKWARDWSYLRLEIKDFPHEPDIMIFLSLHRSANTS